MAEYIEQFCLDSSTQPAQDPSQHPLKDLDIDGSSFEYDFTSTNITASPTPTQDCRNSIIDALETTITDLSGFRNFVENLDQAQLQAEKKRLATEQEVFRQNKLALIERKKKLDLQMLCIQHDRKKLNMKEQMQQQQQQAIDEEKRTLAVLKAQLGKDRNDFELARNAFLGEQENMHLRYLAAVARNEVLGGTAGSLH